jgi:hypothetical protein
VLRRDRDSQPEQWSNQLNQLQSLLTEQHKRDVDNLQTKFATLKQDVAQKQQQQKTEILHQV